MRDDWRDPGYWRWWWQDRVSGSTKFALFAALAILLAVAGFASAGRLSEERSAQVVTTERVVTVMRKVNGGVVTEVQTVTGTVTARETELVTVRRNGRTVVIRRPAETVTDTDRVRGPVRTRTETDVRTKTQTETSTVDRPTTVTNTVDRPTTVTETGPGRTETVTETRDVPGPTHTVTETETNETTVTEEVTVTETVTETETVTVTETGG